MRKLTIADYRKKIFEYWDRLRWIYSKLYLEKQNRDMILRKRLVDLINDIEEVMKNA